MPTVRQQVLKLLQQGPLTGAEIADRLGIKRKRVSCALTTMHIQNRVHVHAVVLSSRATHENGEQCRVYAYGPLPAGAVEPSTRKVNRGAQRKAPPVMPKVQVVEVRPFRDELQCWMFGQPGQGVQHGAR